MENNEIEQYSDFHRKKFRKMMFNEESGKFLNKEDVKEIMMKKGIKMINPIITIDLACIPKGMTIKEYINLGKFDVNDSLKIDDSPQFKR